MLPLIRKGKEAKLGEPAGSLSAVRLSDALARSPVVAPVVHTARCGTGRRARSSSSSAPPLGAGPVTAVTGSGGISKATLIGHLGGRQLWNRPAVCARWGRRLICSPERGARRADLPSGCDAERCRFGRLGGRWR